MSEISLLLQGGLFLIALLTFIVVLIDKLKK
ncbi:putative holin-like toxin [Bacillus mycoides]|nr:MULTISPECIES: putative holin-like toxin [Bacillus]WJE32545.1 putative holin-like toxin [Bacillus mycoides]WOA61259.1 putative holin-like toxin [Bacillus mycoides]